MGDLGGPLFWETTIWCYYHLVWFCLSLFLFALFESLFLQLRPRAMILSSRLCSGPAFPELGVVRSWLWIEGVTFYMGSRVQTAGKVAATFALQML